MENLRDQLERNLRDMARELARDPCADQREWDAMISEVFGCSVANLVTVSLASAHFGRGTSCDKTELGQEDGKDCHRSQSKIVTATQSHRRNRMS